MFFVLLSAALASERAVVLLAGPSSGDMDARERVVAALSGTGVSEVAWRTAGSLSAEIDLIAVEDREEDILCGGVVASREWEVSLGRAETSIQLLDVQGALAALSLAELEAGCLDGPLDRMSLQRLHLGIARANLLAAMGADGSTADFHEEQARKAVGAMLALGDDLLLPQGLEPEIQALIELRPYVEPVPLVGGGKLGAVLLDGSPVGRLPKPVAPGAHVVQVVSSGEVVAAARIDLGARPTLLWAGPADPSDLVVELEGVAAGLPGSDLLVRATSLLGEQVVIASVRPDEVLLFRPDGTPIDVEAPIETPVVEGPEPIASTSTPLEGPWLLGLGPSLAWTALGEDHDLVGLTGGGSIWLRYAIREDVRVALTLGGRGRRDPLPTGYDENFVYRATIPLRLGARLAREHPSIGLELGADALLDISGVYPDGPGLRLGALFVVSVARPLPEDFRLKLDARGGGGLRYLSGGVTLGVERSF